MTAEPFDLLLRDGQEAYQRGDAVRARECFRLAVDERATGAALEGLAKSHHLGRDYRAAMVTYERAYTACRSEGEHLAAARCARTVGWFRGSLYGDWAVYSGWLDRANSLLARGDTGGSEAGWLLLAAAQRGDQLEVQQRQYLEVIEIARRFSDGDLECDALACLGIMLVFSGRSDGMRYLDHALAAVCGGEAQELSVVEGVMCGLFNACERTHDVARAEQWLRAADELVRRRGLVAVGGYCRSYFGGILTAAGRWVEAETELRVALDTFAPDQSAVRENILTRLAMLRMLQGRVEEAAELLVGIEDRDDALRTVAMAHLARDEPALAVEILDRALTGGSFEDAFEGPLLATLADAHLATGALDRAANTADRLDLLAAGQSSEYLHALAGLVRGRVGIATGSGDVRDVLQQALTTFVALRLPLDAAHTHFELARALASEPEVAVAHARSALETFERLPARREIDQTAAFLRSLGAAGRAAPRGTGGLTRRESEVLDLLGHGLSNLQIADRLFVSPKTVEHHVAKVLAKLGLRSRAQVSAYLARVGIGEK